MSRSITLLFSNNKIPGIYGIPLADQSPLFTDLFLIIPIQKTVYCIRVFYRFKEARFWKLSAGNSDMNRIIRKSVPGSGLITTTSGGARVPELPHPVRCPGPTGYVEGDVPLPVQATDLDTIEIFNHPLRRIAVLRTVCMT